MAFAPSSLGGKVSYVVVNGISMEPGYHMGDLTIMRRASGYQIGDVVTYRDAQMQAYVIHRIIALDQDRYVLKGDNNSWIDAYRPTDEEIVGKLWIYIPKLGKAFKWLRTPVNMVLTVGLLGGVLMSGMVFKPSQPGKRKSRPSINPGPSFEWGIYLLGFSALAFLALGTVTFFLPLNRSAEKIQYWQESKFSYSANGTSVIYDTETVRSGEPVFPRLTCFLNIAFTYNVIGEQLQGISGSHRLIARVLEEQSGWQRTIPMNEQGVFTGSSFSTTSTLDLCQIVSLVNVLKQETGLRATNFTLEIVPQVNMTASAAGHQITDTFEPRLTFRFDEVHFSLLTPKGQDDPLYLSQQGLAENFQVEANTISLLGWKPRVGSLRVFALLGLGMSLSGLLLLGSRIFTNAQYSPDVMIRLKYGALLVNVYERDLTRTTMLIDVTTIDELAKLAERHNTVILHMTYSFLHCYLVQCNGVTYRYVFSAGRRGTAVIEAPRPQVINGARDRIEFSVAGTEPDVDDLIDYMLNQGSVSHTQSDDTVIMQKIRL